MPLRTCVLWRRLLHVWTPFMNGETLSSAAHAAGFADSAHLSRTSRTMFGLPPSVLQMMGPLSARARGTQQTSLTLNNRAGQRPGESGLQAVNLAPARAGQSQIMRGFG